MAGGGGGRMMFGSGPVVYTALARDNYIFGSQKKTDERINSMSICNICTQRSQSSTINT